MTQELRLRRLAYHEAGHAVVTRALGINLDCVHIWPKGGDTHRLDCFHDICAKLGGEVEARKALAKIQLAGIEAQQRWQNKLDQDSKDEFGRDDAAQNDHGSKQDIMDAQANVWRIAELPDSGPPFSLENAQADANELIEHNWHRVIALASELLKRGTIAGPDAEKIIATA